MVPLVFDHHSQMDRSTSCSKASRGPSQAVADKLWDPKAEILATHASAMASKSVAWGRDRAAKAQSVLERWTTLANSQLKVCWSASDLFVSFLLIAFPCFLSLSLFCACASPSLSLSLSPCSYEEAEMPGGPEASLSRQP